MTAGHTATEAAIVVSVVYGFAIAQPKKKAPEYRRLLNRGGPGLSQPGCGPGRIVQPWLRFLRLTFGLGFARFTFPPAVKRWLPRTRKVLTSGR